MVFGRAGAASEKLIANAIRQSNGALTRPANGGKLVFGTQPGRTEPPLALIPRAKYRHGLARARPDSPAFRPLHSLPHSATPTPQDAFARSDGHKLPRQAKKTCATQVEES